jgi:hypothetical protein
MNYKRVHLQDLLRQKMAYLIKQGQTLNLADNLDKKK